MDIYYSTEFISQAQIDGNMVKVRFTLPPRPKPSSPPKPAAPVKKDAPSKDKPSADAAEKPSQTQAREC